MGTRDAPPPDAPQNDSSKKDETLSPQGISAMQGNDEAVAALEKRVEQLREQKQAEEAARLAELQAQKVEPTQEPPPTPSEKTVVTIHPRGSKDIEKEPGPETEPRSIEGR
jgi:hypothetical protein